MLFYTLSINFNGNISKEKSFIGLATAVMSNIIFPFATVVDNESIYSPILEMWRMNLSFRNDFELKRVK